MFGIICQICIFQVKTKPDVFQLSLQLTLCLFWCPYDWFVLMPFCSHPQSICSFLNTESNNSFLNVAQSFMVCETYGNILNNNLLPGMWRRSFKKQWLWIKKLTGLYICCQHPPMKLFYPLDDLAELPFNVSDAVNRADSQKNHIHSGKMCAWIS